MSPTQPEPLRSADEITVLIPAAGRVQEGIIALSNVSTPAMIPVAGRPVIQWTIDYLMSLGLSRFVVGVRERGQFLEEFLDCVFGDRISVEYVVPPEKRGLASTVAALAAATATPGALVVLGDTNFEFEDPTVLERDEPFVLVGDVDESYRWCVAELADDGTVSGYRDKQPDLPIPLMALVGVYFFPDVERLRFFAEDALAGSGETIELSDVLSALGSKDPIYAHRVGRWLDCGNPDTQVAAARTLLQERSFNQLTIDPVRATITKRSHHTEKFVDEINYLQLLPSDLQPLFPRCFNASTDWSDAWVELEFYGYPTLAELFVFEKVDPGLWGRVLERLRHVIVELFMARRRPLAHVDVVAMYLGKVESRMRDLSGPPELMQLIGRDALTINGVTRPSLAVCRSEVANRVDALAATAVGGVIHGDLCFSNVLYDLRAGICRFIDPRGSFGRPGLFGDPRYDVAKLWHSVYGLYDFITADLFHLHVDSERIELDIRTRSQHDLVRHTFESVFAQDFDMSEIRLITALIFLGLPALHEDAPNRQIAFYARGLELLDDALTEKGSTCGSA
jgi:dTDP-glucose pyrophosphorylase